MFGYVRPPLQTLPPEEAERFRQIYCGLCHVLGRQYGPAARFILNYDFAYLAILLSEQEEKTREKRCLPHPIHRRAYLQGGAALELAADESVILAYWQLRDGVEDCDWFHGCKYRMISGVLESAYHKAAHLRPAFDQAVRRQLERLKKLEGTACASIDQAADSFAELLVCAVGEIKNPVRQRVLEQILYHLGRWIYLMDAADDLQRDLIEGTYNPVALRYGLIDGVWTEEARREFTATLDHSIHMIATAFELWDFGVWRPILEQTIYTGLFQVGKAVLDGTFHAARFKIEKET